MLKQGRHRRQRKTGTFRQSRWSLRRKRPSLRRRWVRESRALGPQLVAPLQWRTCRQRPERARRRQRSQKGTRSVPAPARRARRSRGPTFRKRIPKPRARSRRLRPPARERVPRSRRKARKERKQRKRGQTALKVEAKEGHRAAAPTPRPGWRGCPRTPRRRPPRRARGAPLPGSALRRRRQGGNRAPKTSRWWLRRAERRVRRMKKPMMLGRTRRSRRHHWRRFGARRAGPQ
mmetsp:Transcript_33621/g.71450  ORF Transcript_33621/g.71450 Transcript_33621/m.71450 type:complete len:233 (+) Transcript_33621:2927-3625(+)